MTKNIIIVGAGRRVKEDVIPAVESLPEYRIVGVYARHQGEIQSKDRSYTVEQLGTLGDVAQSADILYLAVPPRAMRAVAEKFVATASHLELIIDTPAPYSSADCRVFRRFKKVHVAEDSIYLPWLDTVRMFCRERQVKIMRVFCDRSVRRYHGLALAKVLCGSLDKPARARVGWRLRKNIWFLLGRISVRLREPRDYAVGEIFIETTNGTLTSHEHSSAHHIKLVQSGAQCRGFAVEDMETTLLPDESALLGPVDKGDTIVSCMLDLKRVGLRRLLEDVHRGKTPWPFEEGMNDARVDHLVHRYWFYFSL